MNWKELRSTATSVLITKYEAHSEELEWKLGDIENQLGACNKLSDCYGLSRKLFSLLQSETPSRQLTEGFERVRALLYERQEIIMERIKNS